MIRSTEETLYASVRVKNIDVLVRFAGETTVEHRLRQLVASLSQRTGFDLYAGFVADKTALGHVLLRTLKCFPVRFIPTFIYSHLPLTLHNISN